MPGVKIVLDTAEAERGSRRLKKELKDLGSEAVSNEKDFKKLEDRLHEGMKADKAKKNIDNLQRSLHLTRLETVKLKTSIGDYGGALTTLTAGTGKAASQIALLGAAMSAVGVGGAAVLGKGFLETAKSFERFETQLKTITGSSEKAKAAMAWITEFTAKTPYELDQVTGSFVKLKSYGLDATQWLTKLGNTSAAMGKSLDQAVEMFADAAVGEFERLKEFGVKASTQGDIVTFKWSQNGQDMVKSTQKTQSGITMALGEIFSRFDGSMDDLSNTWEGMTSNLSDTWTLFQKQVMDSGPFEAMKAGLKSFLDYLSTNEGQMDMSRWAQSTAGSVVDAFRLMAKGSEIFLQSIASIRLSFGAVMKEISEAQVWYYEQQIESVNNRNINPGGRPLGRGLVSEAVINSDVSEYQQKLADAKANLEAANDMIDGNSQAIIDAEAAYQKINITLQDFKKNTKDVSLFGGGAEIETQIGGASSQIGKASSETEKALQQFNNAFNKATLSDFDYRLKKLDEEYDRHDKVVKDKLELEIWYSAEVQNLLENREKEEEERNKKAAAEASRAATAIASAMDQMYKDIGLQGDENYQYQVGLLDAQALKYKELYKKMGIDASLVDRWRAAEHENLEKQKTLDSNNFFAGMRIGLQDSETDFRTWAEHGESISRSMSSNMHSAFSDSLFLALKGDLDDISQVWDGFMDSMLHKLTDTVSEMAVKWGIGAVGSVTGWWDTGAWEIKKDHVAMVHAGEMIVPADVAEIIRNGSGRDSISDLAQVSPSGGHEWAAEDAKMIEGFMTGTKESFAVGHLAQGASLAAQGYLSVGDFISGLANPDALAGAVIGSGLPTGVNNALGLLSDPWGVWGQRVLGGMGGVAMGPAGSALGGFVGGLAGMVAGDITNTRKHESLFDDLENNRGWFGGLMAMSAIKSSVRDFSNIDEVALALEQYDYAMKYKADLAALREPGRYPSGMWNAAYQRSLDPGWMDPDQRISPFSANPDAPSYGGGYGRGGHGDGKGYGGGEMGGAKDGSDNDNSGIGGWAEGGVIDRLMVPYGEDGWAAVQFGEGVVSKEGMETLAKINKGNIEAYPKHEDDLATTITITNNIQRAVLDVLGSDMPADLKLQSSGIILDDMADVVELFNLILEDGIDSTELKTAYQSFIGVGLAAQDAAVATNLLIDEYEKQERVAKDAEQALDAQLAQREKQSQVVSNLEIQALNALGEKEIAAELSRALDLKSMDASLHPLQQFIWSLEDAAEATDDFSSAFSNIDNAINNIMTGGAMGVQSVDYYERRYSELMSDAYADPTKVGAFTTFASSYLNFMSDYGDPRVMEQVLADLSALQDTVENEITMADQITGAEGKTLSDLYNLLAQTEGWDPGMGAIESMVTDAYADIGRFTIGTRPDQIDQAGWNYWVDELVSGDISPKDFPLAFSTAAGIWGETETGWRRQDEFSFSGGGVISGPMSGYTLPTTFHGVERIVPETDFQDMTNLLRQLVHRPSGGGDIQVRVYIGNQELRSHTADVIRTDPETQNQIRRVARV